MAIAETWYEVPFGVTADTYEQTGTLRLGERFYAYRLLWSTRGSYWALSLWTQEGVPVIVGRPLHLGVDVLERSTAVGRPPGTLTVWREDWTLAPYGHDDLGSTARAWYVE